MLFFLLLQALQWLFSLAWSESQLKKKFWKPFKKVVVCQNLATGLTYRYIYDELVSMSTGSCTKRLKSRLWMKPDLTFLTSNIYCPALLLCSSLTYDSAIYTFNAIDLIILQFVGPIFVCFTKREH